MLLAAAGPHALTDAEAFSGSPGEGSAGGGAVAAAAAAAGAAAAGAVLKLRRSPHGSHFVALTTVGLTLWSVKPLAAISRVLRSQRSIEEAGENKDVVWKWDASAICVVTTLGYLHFYAVISPDEKAFSYQFTRQLQYAVSAVEGGSIGYAELRYRGGVQVDPGVTCAENLRDDLIVCTDIPCRLVHVSWAGQYDPTAACLLTEMSFLTNSDASAAREVIMEITYSRSLNLFGWIMSSGRAYIVSPSGTPDKDIREIQWVGQACRGLGDYEGAPHATHISINSRLSLAAVGTNTGEVYIYSIPEVTGNISFSHRLSFKYPPGITQGNDLGEVTSLSWTPDGMAIAVGYYFGGFSVWSVFGKALVSSISEDGFLHSLDIEPNLTEKYFYGVNSLFWGPECFDLFMAPRHMITDQIYVLPFAKNTYACCYVQEPTMHSLLLTENRIWIYAGDNTISYTSKSDVNFWNVIQIPHTYMVDNWPIKYATMSPDACYVAVAGKRGFTYFSVLLNRWKMFGNQQHEQDFACRGGLLWYKEYLIVACQDMTNIRSEIRVYHRDNNLDNSRILRTEVFTRTILMIRSWKNVLLVYQSDNTAVLYEMEAIDIHSFGLKLQRTLSFVNAIPNPFLVQNIGCMLSHSDQDDNGDYLKLPLLVLMNGRLLLIDTKDKMRVRELGGHIELFWTYRSKGPEIFRKSIWAFDGESMKVWIPLGSSVQDLEVKMTADLRFEIDFYPLAVLLEKGMVVGVEQRIFAKNSIGLSNYKIVMKTQLFINHVIRYILMRRMESEAVVCAKCYEHFDYFGHALELLLHNVLEEEAETLIGFSQDAVLPSVVSFLRNFPHFYDVVVRCARKTEVALWEYLFSIIGDPKEFFENCLSAGQLKTATSYLIILQTLEPFSVSGKDSVLLLEAALESEDFELCGELVRFLSSIGGMDKPARICFSIVSFHIFSNRRRAMSLMKMNPHMTYPGSTPYQELVRQKSMGISGFEAVSVVQSRTRENTSKPYNEHNEMFHLDILLSRHARKLMQKYRIRILARFANSLSFPLTDWLRKERNRGALISNMTQAFCSLHEQFAWPWPNEDTESETFSETSPSQQEQQAQQQQQQKLSQEQPTRLQIQPKPQKQSKEQAESDQQDLVNRSSTINDLGRSSRSNNRTVSDQGRPNGARRMSAQTFQESTAVQKDSSGSGTGNSSQSPTESSSVSPTRSRSIEREPRELRDRDLERTQLILKSRQLTSSPDLFTSSSSSSSSSSSTTASTFFSSAYPSSMSAISTASNTSTTTQSLSLGAGPISASANSISSAPAPPQGRRRRAHTLTSAPIELVRAKDERDSKVSEIMFLFKACRDAECYGWALLLACLLQEVRLIVGILHDRKASDLREPLRLMLMSPECPGYIPLLNSITDLIGDL